MPVETKTNRKQFVFLFPNNDHKRKDKHEEKKQKQKASKPKQRKTKKNDRSQRNMINSYAQSRKTQVVQNI